MTDLNTAKQIFEMRDYDLTKLSRHAELQASYLECLKQKKTPLIVDCGGNIGFASLYFSLTFPQAKIVCVEPDKSNVIQAKLNNKNRDVDFHQAAIGSVDAQGSIVDPGLGNNAFRVSKEASGDLEIQSITSILKRPGIANAVPFIVKIDIEGFENELFSKNTEWVDQFPLLIIELHDWMLPKTANSNQFLQVISKLDRDFVYMSENVFSISNSIDGQISR